MRATQRLFRDPFAFAKQFQQRRSSPFLLPQRCSGYNPRPPCARQTPSDLSGFFSARHSSTASPPATTAASRVGKTPESPPGSNFPALVVTFTCKLCVTRSAHKISQQGYLHGTILIKCPNCKNRHVLTDHLKIFHDEPKDMVAIMKDAGEVLQRGSLINEDGDFELWDDGTGAFVKDGPLQESDGTLRISASTSGVSSNTRSEPDAKGEGKNAE